MKELQLFRHMARSAASLWYDTRGIMLPYVTVVLVVLVGVSLLAVDGAGRAFSLQTQLENIADAAALLGLPNLIASWYTPAS